MEVPEGPSPCIGLRAPAFPVVQHVIMVLYYYVFNLNLLNNEYKIGRRPIKGIFWFLFNFVQKWAQNRPKADRRKFCVFHFNFLKNELKIGRRTIKEDYYMIQIVWDAKNALILLRGRPRVKSRCRPRDYIQTSLFANY
jgi:hypothetical protein